MICSNDILNLKSNIFDKIGQKIIIKGSLGRNKCFEREATIDKVYSNIFTIKYLQVNNIMIYLRCQGHYNIMKGDIK